jgi:hypothetical protein
MSSWKHDDLANDLAAHLRGASDRMVWTDMQLGPVGSPRPDVYTVPCSFAKFRPIAYEIKISVADFRRDVTAGKWMSYLKYASGVIFCVPAGLIKKEDVPAGCGLMTRGETGWRALKGPTLKPVETLPRDAWIKLLIDGIGRIGDQVRVDLRGDIENEWALNQRVRAKLGNLVGQAIVDNADASDRLARETARLGRAAEDARKEYQAIVDGAKDRARQESAQVDAARNELARALGLEAGAGTWEIAAAARAASARLDADSEIERLRSQVRSIDKALKRALAPMPVIAGGEAVQESSDLI